MTPGYICQIRSTRDAMSPALSVFRHACIYQRLGILYPETQPHSTDSRSLSCLDPPHISSKSCKCAAHVYLLES